MRGRAPEQQMLVEVEEARVVGTLGNRTCPEHDLDAGEGNGPVRIGIDLEAIAKPEAIQTWHPRHSLGAERGYLPHCGGEDQ